MKIPRSVGKILADIIKAFSLCHNVLPTENESDLQASSPDEVALVKTAQMMGIKLISRSQKYITIERNQNEEKYEILANFPFSSERKRMGILLKKFDDPNEIIFLMKGADIVMKDCVVEV